MKKEFNNIAIVVKPNLTNSKENGAKLFDQTTLFKLNSSTDNGRYNYFSMDATIGLNSKEFFLFGGTGNFERINETEESIDNIVYGIKDKDFPYFNFTNGINISPLRILSEYIALPSKMPRLDLIFIHSLSKTP